MNKSVKYTYRGINQDVTKSKHPFQFYYEANNIRIVTTDTQSTGSVSNEKGNELILTLPQPTIDLSTNNILYNNKSLKFETSEILEQTNISNSCEGGLSLPITSEEQSIIGYSLTRNSIILFSTDSNGFDCIWEVEEIFENDYELTLLYVRNLNFSKESPIQSIFNYENDIIQKIYWVDGSNQLRFLNIKHSTENGDLENLIDINSTNINIAGEYSLSQPDIIQVTNGGNHTSGMIQYAYNLYKLNGSQTTISPLSELVALDFGSSLGGGEVNEIVGSSPLIQIEDIDTRYTHIKLYSVKYTSFNELPEVNVIVDEEIDNYNQFTYLDVASSIESITLSEFLFLGSDPFIPRHIETKDNRMFASNVIDKPYLFEIDSRAYSHNSGGNVLIYKNVSVDPLTNVPSGISLNVNTSTYAVEPKHDSINLNYNTYKYQSDGNTLGGEGKFLKYEIVQKTESQLEDTLKYTQFFKDNEVYRIGIEFFNSLGQTSLPNWIADFRAPEGNLMNSFNTLKVELKPEFYTYIDSLCLSSEETPVGYRIVRADRTVNDRTILCQGSIQGMMVQTTKDVQNFGFWTEGDPFGFSENRRLESLQQAKLPLLTNRGFQDNGDVFDVFPVYNYTHLRMLNEGGGETDQEIYRDDSRDYKRQQTWQYLKMMQLFSPDVLFNTGLSFTSNLELKIIGAVENTITSRWAKVRNVDSGNETFDSFEDNTTNLVSGSNLSMYGPGNDDTDNRTVDVRFLQIYKEYDNYIKNNGIQRYSIYGSPEITERGQGITNYNGDSQFRYTNSLDNLLSDRYRRPGQSEKDENAITSANAFGARCVTFVEGNVGEEEINRLSLVDIYNNTNIGNTNVMLMGEFIYPEYYAYVGNIYGGNTYEAKTRTSYIEIGRYNNISVSEIQIDSPGDTFVQNFNFGRLLKTDVEKFNGATHQVSEILNYKVETSINLQNRGDLSLLGWNNKFQPRYDEYHEYNRVYSQQPTLIQNQDVSFKFKKANAFDTRIITSKAKIPGEIIDNFTDFLQDEILDLDGKYGAINAMVNYNDEIYLLQDRGVAHISINPRAQVQSNDGLSIELGRGGILYDHQYLTTTSGTVNKWSVYNSPTGFYYLDVINKSWNKFQGGGGIMKLTDINGLHAYFENNIDYSNLILDNPLLNKGATGGFNFINNNAYLTVLQDNNSFTLNFNENTNSFESFHDYKPSIYINRGYKMYTTSPDLNKLYEHDRGDYQKFYEEYYPSYIILQINPESDLDCVFNNIMYKSEVYLNDIDQPNKTLSHIQAYNEYQDTGRIELQLSRSKNLRRKFRNWQAQIPRQQNSRDRIRNPWVFLKLEFDQNDNLKLILHDLIVHYTV